VVVVGQLGDGDTLPARGANSLAFSREREGNPSGDTPLARTGNTRLSKRFLGRLLADDAARVRVSRHLITMPFERNRNILGSWLT
jgi:hypothetical protein